MNREKKDIMLKWFLRIITYFIIIAVGWIVGDIVVKGLPVISWEFLFTSPRNGGTAGGIWPAIIGTIYLVFGTIVIALPLGMGAAIYLAEYANQTRFTRMIRLAIVTLAGVPSIVFGLFGLGLFVIFMKFGTSIIAGNLTLACMILPTIIVSSEEALRAVPKGLREASLALGVTKWQTILKNVLPYAIPGMMTGSILSVGRVAGETAPILLTVAAFFLPRLPTSVFDQVMALPYHLFILATQHHETELVRPLQYGTALVLIGLVLGMNLIAIFLRMHFRKKYKW